LNKFSRSQPLASQLFTQQKVDPVLLLKKPPMEKRTAGIAAAARSSPQRPALSMQEPTANAAVRSSLGRRSRPPSYLSDPASLPVSPRSKQQPARTSAAAPPRKESPRYNAQLPSWHSHMFGRGAGFQQKVTSNGSAAEDTKDKLFRAQGIVLSKDGSRFVPRPPGTAPVVTSERRGEASTVPQRISVIY
jgi:hypothetical protein